MPRTAHQTSLDNRAGASSRQALHSDCDRAALRGAWWWLALPPLLAIVLLAAPFAMPEFYMAHMLPEGYGALEFAHFIMPLVTAFYTVALLIRLRAVLVRPVFVLLAVFAAGNIYISGEEQSWGQHFFNWSTPEYWTTVNRQAETNLHNTTSWLNQRPRAVLEIGIIVLGVMALLRPGSALLARLGSLTVLVPPPAFLPVALVMALVKIAGETIEAIRPQMTAARFSEIHETFIVMALLYYIIMIAGRLRAGAPHPMTIAPAP